MKNCNQKHDRKKSWIERAAAMLLMTAMLVTLCVQPVFATTSISSVSITLDLSLTDGASLPDLETGYIGETGPEVKISESAHYDITNATWSKNVKSVELGETYSLKVTLEAKDDYVFKSSYSSSKITVKGGTFVSARRGKSNEELVVTVKSKPVEGTLETPTNVEWKSTNSRNSKFGYAAWDAVGSAAYDVQLYRNNKVVHKVSGLKRLTYNFYPYMTKEGDYSFRVRAVPVDSDMKAYAEKSDWEYSDEMYVDEDEVSDGTGQEVGVNSDGTPNVTDSTQVGWIASNGKWYFRYPDGTYLRDAWGLIGDIWYLFDSNGMMLTGWQNRNGHYYYMNQSGAMVTGWLLDGNVWYYLNADGAMATGWITVNNQTYYLSESGAMVTGWKEIGGQFYYFYPDGHKAVNEVISGFYVDTNGVWKRPTVSAQ